MKQKIFSLLVLLMVAVSGAWAQEADNCPNVGQKQSRATIVSRRAAASIASEVTLSFDCSSASQYGVASDGNFIYTSSWTSASSSMFYKYDLDGNFVEEFNISGCGYVRDMTYDGTYFYGVANGSVIYQIDFENKTLVGTINIADMSMRGITYDPVRDGFWVVGNWSGPLALYNRNGNKIQEGIYAGSVSGMAYYEDRDGEEHILQLNNNNNNVYDYNITTNTNQGVVFNLNNIPGPNGSSGGCFIGDYKGQVCMFADVQQTPNRIGILPITNAKANGNLIITENAHGKVAFKVGDNIVYNADEGDLVTMTITPNENWAVGKVTGEWIATQARAPQRRTSGLGLLQDVDLTFVSEDAVTRAQTYTFEMQRAKAEFAVKYKKMLTHEDITITVDDAIYTGHALNPDVEVKDGETVLVKDKDYTVTFLGNTNAGTGTATFKGIGDNYAGEKKVEFKVIKAEGLVLFYPSEVEKTYGDANFTLKPNTRGDGVLTFASDKPEIAAVDAATGEVTIKSAGKVTIRATMAEGDNYFGDTDWCELIIAPKALADGMFTQISSPVYTGEPLVPNVVMKDGETLMKMGTDYTLDFEDNVNAGTAKVTATGVGNYQGTATTTFAIAQAALTAVTLEATNFVYNQQEHEAKVTSVKAGNLDVPEDSYEVTGNKATKVGFYTVTVTGKGNFKGTAQAQWSIVPDAEAVFALTLDPTEFVYDGTEKKPAVTVKDGDAVLVEGTDYTLAYANNVNAGTATVTATGKGNYNCTKTVEFTIKKADVTMTAPTVKLGLIYTAQAQTLVAAGTVQGGEMQYALDGENFATALPQGTDAKDYTVSYKVVGDQNHNDVEAQTINVTIIPATLTAATLVETNLVYNQLEQVAQVASVSAGTLTVPEGSYEVTGNKATNVGNYTATITGKGNFKGSVTAQFSIVADQSVLFDLTLNPTEYVYDGTEKRPEVIVKDGETVLVENTDYTLVYANNVNAGTATVTATGKGNYVGTKTAEFTIKKADVTMTAPTIMLGMIYTAQAQTLIAAGSAEGGEMQYALDDVNYSTTLPQGTDAKEYSVYFKVVGDQNYNDVEAQILKVTIAQAELTAATLVETSLVYNQQEQTVQVASVMAGNLVVPADGYEVTGNKATNVGFYTATITGKGNFKGEVTAQYGIVPDAEAVFALTLDPTEFVYDGTEKKPAVTVKVGETVLVEDTDYTLAFENNVNAGTAKVTATGKGNYVGTKTVEFTIAQAEITAFELAATKFVYNKQEQVAQVVSVSAGTLVVPEEGYEVSGNKATEVGTYTVTVAGKGNFKGELKAQFTIVADKTALDAAIADAADYYESIKADYADVAATLLEVINAAKGVQADEAATQKAVDDAVEALKKAVQDAKYAVEVITSINSAKVDANSVWYDMKGRKLEGKPTKKGVYVVNGRKVVIK